jgi:hypothetical protein
MHTEHLENVKIGRVGFGWFVSVAPRWSCSGGNTIPFIARYRKEATGELDEVQIRDIRDRHEYLTELDERRARSSPRSRSRGS